MSSIGVPLSATAAVGTRSANRAAAPKCRRCRAIPPMRPRGETIWRPRRAPCQRSESSLSFVSPCGILKCLASFICSKPEPTVCEEIVNVLRIHISIDGRQTKPIVTGSLRKCVYEHCGGRLLSWMDLDGQRSGRHSPAHKNNSPAEAGPVAAFGVLSVLGLRLGV